MIALLPIAYSTGTSDIMVSSIVHNGENSMLTTAIRLHTDKIFWLWAIDIVILSGDSNLGPTPTSLLEFETWWIRPLGHHGRLGRLYLSSLTINPEDNQQRRRSQVKEGALSSSLNHHPVLHPPLEHLYESYTKIQ